MRWGRRVAVPAAALLALAAGLAPLAAGAGPRPAHAVSPLAALGREIFFDRSLSASGRLACASCHSPAQAYGPPNGLAVQRGGPGLDRQGLRAAPSLRYTLNRTPRWHAPYTADPAELYRDGPEPPSGGFGWDGRFDSLRAQAAYPLLAPEEMANPSAAAVAAKLSAAPYASGFRKLFGRRVFAEPERAFADALRAIERFELEDPSFHPFTSKYDAYLDGKATLTAQERRGLELFDDPAGGNCASCHPDTRGADGSHPLFTDFEFEALGVPRNPEIRANADPSHYDLGLCGPLRHDQAAHTRFCGAFKTPTLRNVATRKAFFHNGRFHRLRDVLRFYASRDSNPQRWYPKDASGRVEAFDDLPAPLRRNVDVHDAPLNRARGAPPLWSDADIEAVLAFLETLTDSDADPAGEPAASRGAPPNEG